MKLSQLTISTTMGSLCLICLQILSLTTNLMQANEVTVEDNHHIEPTSNNRNPSIRDLSFAPSDSDRIELSTISPPLPSTTFALDSNGYSDSLYRKWSPWSKCTKNCKQTRSRACKRLNQCEASVVREERRCRIPRCRNKNKNNNKQHQSTPTINNGNQRNNGTTLGGNNSARNHTTTTRPDRQMNNRNPNVNQQRHRNSTTTSTNNNQARNTGIISSSTSRINSTLQDNNNRQQQNRRKKEDTKVLYHLQNVIYSNWSDWSPCSDNCITTRTKTCKVNVICGSATIIEKAICYIEGTSCERYMEPTIKRKLVVGGNGYNNLLNLFGNNHLDPSTSTGDTGITILNSQHYNTNSNSNNNNDHIISENTYDENPIDMLYPDHATAMDNVTTTTTTTSTTTMTTTTATAIAATTTTAATTANANNNRNETINDNINHSDYNLEPNKELIYPIDDSTCGIMQMRDMQSVLRIVGGIESSNGSWPWQVVVLDKNKDPICGGTLLTPEFVLTAAHCVKGRLHVRAGEHDLSFQDNWEQEEEVSKYFKHPAYDPQLIDSDIAVLKLKYPFNLTQNVWPACLPGHKDVLKSSTMATILGWGVLNHTEIDFNAANRSAIYQHTNNQQQQQQQQQMQYTRSNHSRLRFANNDNSMPRYLGANILNQARVPIADFEHCKRVYQGISSISDNMLCAGYRSGGVDSCTGDSGGPLLVQKKNHRWYVYGVTSFGEGCGKKGKYGIYSKTTNFVEWIRATVHEYGSKR